MAVNAGETGDQLVELVLSEINGLPDEISRQIVYARVLRALQAYRLYVPPKPQERKVEPMSDREAGMFECSSMPFGKYQGVDVGSVPIEYLCRLIDPSGWMQDLKRYLASKMAQERMEEEN